MGGGSRVQTCMCTLVHDVSDVAVRPHWACSAAVRSAQQQQQQPLLITRQQLTTMNHTLLVLKAKNKKRSALLARASSSLVLIPLPFRLFLPTDSHSTPAPACGMC